MATIIQKEGEVISYEISDPGKLDSSYWNKALTELTVVTGISAGLPLIGSLMSSELRGNYKIMWNSPNELNPTQFKIVQPTPSMKSPELFGSIADSTGGGVLSHVGGALQTPGGKVIELPATASLSVEDAIAWQQTMAGQLPSLVNRNASLREQAFQAVQLENQIMALARNAMDDANAAAQLSMTTPARTFDEILRSRATESAGDALYRQVIEDAAADMRTMRKVSQPGGCFVAGTLVHTREGLKPIEDIKVGDWVLSQPEETGERAYKRVVRTFQFEDKELWSVSIYEKDKWDQARSENRMISDDIMRRLVVTPNHPFWVKGRGWTQARDLDPLLSDEGLELELSDGRSVLVDRAAPLYISGTEGVAWLEGVFDPDNGRLIDLRNRKSGESEFSDKRVVQPNSAERGNPSSFFRSSVHNLEVEDYHTYYVGTLGIWVHNTNCAEDPGSRAQAIANGLVPNNGLGVYFTEAEARQLGA